jgi:hypothetical protein
MIWYTVVLLLLLSLGVGGCGDRSPRLRSSPTAPYAEDEPTNPRGDDLPTPRFFQIDRSTGGGEGT